MTMSPVEQLQRPARIAAVGDLHCRESQREEIAAAFAAIAADVDLVLLAGDLTTHGEPEQAQILADACRPLATPLSSNTQKSRPMTGAETL
jgi:predicted MPP superfamily phosphohydrolase